MKKRLIIELQAGDTLDIQDTEKVTKSFNYLYISGAYDDSFKINLNGVDMIVSGGAQLNFPIESLTVVAVYKNSSLADADIKVIAYGYEQRLSLFGN